MFEIVEFIRTLYPNSDKIQLHVPVFSGNERNYLNECINSTFVSSVGKYVDIFEDKIAEYTGAKKAVACVNGTNALYLALQLCGVKQNDEVITQSLTFVASANAISYCNASPVFVDIDQNTLGLCPIALEKWLDLNAIKKNGITINKKTNRKLSACVPMHTFGFPVKIDRIIEICNNYNIPVVEDAAESLGSLYKNKHTGTYGEIGIMSFNGNKIITTGGGGMLLFNNIELAAKAKHLTTQAKIPHKWEFIHDSIGYNYRMPNINAALGVAQLENIGIFKQNKRETAKKYQEFFHNSEYKYFNEPLDSDSNYWLNTIICKSKNDRDDFLKFTNEKGIMTRPAWKLMHTLPMFKKCETDGLQNAIYFGERIVNLPSSVII
jgi:perosamine synthetase